MNNCTNQTLDKQVVLVLCYRRTIHLRQVISALESAFLIDSFTVVFVVQDPISSVMKIIENCHISKKHILKIDGAGYHSSAQAINGNLAVGLQHAFRTLGAGLVVVLEDDIVISRDALCYFRQVASIYSGDKKFRGVNGFSREVGSPSFRNEYLRLNMGVGWGWAIPKRSYDRIVRYWVGAEDNHWDFIFEPYIRTGFVVNPFRSRILNIGFDDSATHTSSNVELGSEIQSSFSIDLVPHSCDLTELSKDFTWGPGSINMTKASPLTSKYVYFARLMLYFLYRIDREPKLRYHAIRRRFMNTIKFMS
jgi:hypothetical protein